MLNKRREAAELLTDHLFAAEAAIDDALAKTAALAAAMPQARIRANVAQEVGHQALAEVMDSCGALVEARSKMVETHRRLAQARDALHLPARAFGPTKPSASGEAPAPTLEIVARAAA